MKRRTKTDVVVMKFDIDSTRSLARAQYTHAHPDPHTPIGQLIHRCAHIQIEYAYCVSCLEICWYSRDKVILCVARIE